jgi:hypothetical protein
MKSALVSSFAAIGVAAALIVPMTTTAESRDRRSEKNVLTVDQSADQADARVAILKADLRLTPDQAQHWTGLSSALHDIAVKRAKRWAAANDLQTGRASSASNVTPDQGAQNDERARDASRERIARGTDGIDEMRNEADAYTIQAANLRQVADAAQPLYDSLDNNQRQRLVQFIRQDLNANLSDDRRGSWR